MKSLYEGILGDIETNVNKMEDDIVAVSIIEWLEYNAAPLLISEKGKMLRRFSSYKNSGKYSKYEEWKDIVTVNKDGSVSFNTGITLLYNSNTIAETVPFKIKSVDGKFYVGSAALKTSENFPDEVDSIEFAPGIKIKIENWHVKIHNKYPSNTHWNPLNNFPFSGYNDDAHVPCVHIEKGPTFGKNVVFECTRTGHNIHNRPIIYMQKLNAAILKKIKLINIPYILLGSSRSKIITSYDLNKIKNNIPDTKLITSSKSMIFCEFHYDYCALKTGILIRKNDGDFKDELNGKRASSTELDKILADIKMNNISLL